MDFFRKSCMKLKVDNEKKKTPVAVFSQLDGETFFAQLPRSCFIIHIIVNRMLLGLMSFADAFV